MSEQEGGMEGATHEDCVVSSPEESAETAETEWNPFDEFHGEVDMPAVPKVMARDGLPTNFAPHDDQSDIPALSPESCVCMGVFDEFVVRDEWGDIVARGRFGVERTPSGRYRAKSYDLSWVGSCGWWARNEHLVGEGGWVEVEPIRTPCKHYVRQLAPYYLNPKHKKAFRLCAARRTTEGTFMDISDMGMFACDMRDPPHISSQELIDEFDQKKMKEGKSRTYLPIFSGFDKKDDDGNKGPGGIFSG